MLQQSCRTQPQSRVRLVPSRPYAKLAALAPAKRLQASSAPAGDTCNNDRTHSVAMPESIYCSDQQSLAQAIAAVRTAGSCVMDCEGLELGDAQGRLTLIQLIPITQDPVSYLVDILHLEQQQVSLKPLKQLLSDMSVTKVLFDCRNDAAALWHEQQCELLGVLDLQLLDLLVWESTATEQKRLQRLKGYMKTNPERAPFHYHKVYQISGLRGALISNKVALTPEVQAHLQVKKSLPPGWSTAWLQRPLDQQLLEYAVCDVLTILALYEHFRAAGWLEHFKAEVKTGSAAYAAIYQQIPYQRSNPFQNHPMLPLDVLPRLSPKSSKQAPMRQCSGCLRELASGCFKGGRKYCYVCGCVNDRIKRGLS